MSLENLTIRDAEPVTDVRRRETEAQGKQPRAGNSDGVDVGGTVGSEIGVRRETSAAGADPKDCTSGKGRKADQSSGGVGVRHSSEDLSDSRTDREPRANTWEQEAGRSKGRGDGSAQAGIRTPEKFGSFKRFYIRKQKRNRNIGSGAFAG